MQKKWFVKLKPPLQKTPSIHIGQIALAEEKLAPPSAEKSKKIDHKSNPKNNENKHNPSIVMSPDREKSACGTSLVMNLDKKPTHEIIKLGVTALGRSQHRGASGSDPLSGDGCGLMIQFGPGFFETCPEFRSFNLVYPHFGVFTVFMPENKSAYDEAFKTLQESMGLFKLKLLGNRPVPVDKDKLGIEAQSDEIQLMHYIVQPSEKLESLAELDRYLSLAHLHFEFKVQQLPQKKRAHICSASRQFIVYKTKGKEKEIANIYPDLNNPALTATVVMGHSRFATNTETLIENVQPLSVAMFNGEVNNIRRFIEEIKYHPNFSKLIQLDLKKFDLTRYSDSAIMSYYIKMLQLLGCNGQQIHDAIFHPYDPDKKNAVSEFHDLIGMPGLEGPNGSIRVHEQGEEIEIFVEMDTMGWRPHRGIIDHERRILVTGSELGIVPGIKGDVIELGPGETIKINPVTKEYRLLKVTQEAQKFFSDKLAEIPSIKSSQKYEHVPFQWSATELQERKSRAGITGEIEKTILEPMFNDGKGFTVSMGDDGGDEVTVSGPARFINALKTHFAQITRPPLDYHRESEVMSATTYIGSKALPEEIYQHTWNGTRVDNPIIDNDQMYALLLSDKLKTKIIYCTYPVFGREQAMFNTLKSIEESCIQAVSNGINLLVLSDATTNAMEAPILPSILVGRLDLILRQEGLRHKVTLCLQSSICVTPLEQIVAISLGANIINPYLIFMHDQLYIENRDKFIRQRTSYLNIALKEILAAAARVGIHTLGAGYQGARQISALGLDKEIADYLGIYSELGGIDWVNVSSMVTHMHTRPSDIGKFSYSNQQISPRPGKWNPAFVALWRQIAKGEKTLRDVLPELRSMIRTTGWDNIDGWYRLKPPMIWTPENPMTVIIIGGGAAGVMQAKALLSSPIGNKIKIKILEENPANLFGAIKDGLSPDKRATKEVQFSLLSECLKDSRVEYYGGISVGQNGIVTFEQLNRENPCVIDCRGAPNDKEPTEIEGHKWLISASKVWKAYNGFFDPENPDRYWPFIQHSRSQVKIVVGNGNVAADIIRNLLQDPNNTEAHPYFVERLRKQKPSFIRNIARGSVTQCKITLKELESFEKKQIKVRATFDEESIDESKLDEEQLNKLAFFRNAKKARPASDNEVWVHFHFGCNPIKVYSVGRNILEMEIVNEKGETQYFRGGDFISAIGRDVPEEPSHTPFIAGWASGHGGNLAIIQKSVEKNTAAILAHDDLPTFVR